MSTTTIAIPFVRTDTFLLDAIRSVFAQTCPATFLRLHGDGVNEFECQRLAEELGDRALVSRTPIRRGLAWVLNHIANTCDTEYLFRMDADDVMFPDRVRVTLDAFTDDPSIDVVSGNAVVIDDQSRIRGRLNQSKSIAVAADFMNSSAIVHPTVAARADWFRRNPYDERYVRAQDKALWLRTRGNTNFVRLSDPLLFYRIMPSVAGRKAVTSGKYDRMALREFGPSSVGLVRTGYQYGRSAAADLRTRLGQKLGDPIADYSRRFKSFDQEESSKLESTLEEIRSTVLPASMIQLAEGVE